MLVMCAATANVLGNVDPLIQYLHGLHRYFVQYNKNPFKLLSLCDSVRSLTKTQSFVSAVRKQTAVQLQKYRTGGRSILLS